MSNTFSELGINAALTASLQRNGLTMPTPVQIKAIPAIMSGRDVIAQAHTGTGKTLAFVLPILEQLNTESSDVQALIMTPTRELAIQITTEVKKYTEGSKAQVLAVYGGQDVEAQIRKLKGSAHIVVGTPGRLLDHLRRGTLDLARLSTLVLDEADQMLHMGFLAEVEEIIRQTSDERQTLLFSATIPDSVRQLSGKYMLNPVDVRIASDRVTVPETAQFAAETTDRAKLQTLIHMIERFSPFLAVVFCRTKIRAKKLSEQLLNEGLHVDELHGDLTQAKREAVMKRFRDAKVQILVATDVAARGLDVEGVTHVFNYDIPHDVESYIHRIGRTGRAGDTGMAITLVAPRDRVFLQQIERVVGRIERLVIDSPGMAASDRNNKSVSRSAAKGPRDRRSPDSSRAAAPRNRRADGRNSSNSAEPRRSMRTSSDRTESRKSLKSSTGRTEPRGSLRSSPDRAGRSNDSSRGRGNRSRRNS